MADPMSNTKRDWWQHPEIQSLCNETIYDHHSWLRRVMDAAESIVRRELAGEVEKMDRGFVEVNKHFYFNGELVFRKDVLALLSPHQNDTKHEE